MQASSLTKTKQNSWGGGGEKPLDLLTLVTGS